MSSPCLGSIEPLFLLLISCKLTTISLNYLGLYTGHIYFTTTSPSPSKELLTSGFLHKYTYIYISLANSLMLVQKPLFVSKLKSSEFKIALTLQATRK